MSNLFEQCLAAGKEFEKRKEELGAQRQQQRQEQWDKACLLASEAILENYEEKMKETASKTPNKWAKLYEWKYSDNVKFNDSYLLMLLKRGDLLEHLQKHFDDKHGSGDDRKFIVYYRQLHSKERKQEKYAVFVSWDVDRFDEISKELAENRERSTKQRVRTKGRKQNKEQSE